MPRQVDLGTLLQVLDYRNADAAPLARAAAASVLCDLASRGAGTVPALHCDGAPGSVVQLPPVPWCHVKGQGYTLSLWFMRAAVAPDPEQEAELLSLSTADGSGLRVILQPTADDLHCDVRVQLLRKASSSWAISLRRHPVPAPPSAAPGAETGAAVEIEAEAVFRAALARGRWHLVVLSHTLPFINRSVLTAWVNGAQMLSRPLKYPAPDADAFPLGRMGAGFCGALGPLALYEASIGPSAVLEMLRRGPRARSLIDPPLLPPIRVGALEDAMHSHTTAAASAATATLPPSSTLGSVASFARDATTAAVGSRRSKGASADYTPEFTPRAEQESVDAFVPSPAAHAAAATTAPAGPIRGREGAATTQPEPKQKQRGGRSRRRGARGRVELDGPSWGTVVRARSIDVGLVCCFDPGTALHDRTWPELRPSGRVDVHFLEAVAPNASPQPARRRAQLCGGVHLADVRGWSCLATESALARAAATASSPLPPALAPPRHAVLLHSLLERMVSAGAAPGDVADAVLRAGGVPAWLRAVAGVVSSAPTAEDVASAHSSLHGRRGGSGASVPALAEDAGYPLACLLRAFTAVLPHSPELQQQAVDCALPCMLSALLDGSGAAVRLSPLAARELARLCCACRSLPCPRDTPAMLDGRLPDSHARARSQRRTASARGQLRHPLFFDVARWLLRWRRLWAPQWLSGEPAPALAAPDVASTARCMRIAAGAAFWQVIRADAAAAPAAYWHLLTPGPLVHAAHEVVACPAPEARPWARELLHVLTDLCALLLLPAAHAAAVSEAARRDRGPPVDADALADATGREVVPSEVENRRWVPYLPPFPVLASSSSSSTLSSSSSHSSSPKVRADEMRGGVVPTGPMRVWTSEEGEGLRAPFSDPLHLASGEGEEEEAAPTTGMAAAAGPEAQEEPADGEEQDKEEEVDSGPDSRVQHPVSRARRRARSSLVPPPSEGAAAGEEDVEATEARGGGDSGGAGGAASNKAWTPPAPTPTHVGLAVSLCMASAEAEGAWLEASAGTDGTSGVGASATVDAPSAAAGPLLLVSLLSHAFPRRAFVSLHFHNGGPFVAVRHLWRLAAVGADAMEEAVVASRGAAEGGAERAAFVGAAARVDRVLRWGSLPEALALCTRLALVRVGEQERTLSIGAAVGIGRDTQRRHEAQLRRANVEATAIVGACLHAARTLLLAAARYEQAVRRVDTSAWSALERRWAATSVARAVDLAWWVTTHFLRAAATHSDQALHGTVCASEYLVDGSLRLRQAVWLHAHLGAMVLAPRCVTEPALVQLRLIVVAHHENALALAAVPGWQTSLLAAAAAAGESAAHDVALALIEGVHVEAASSPRTDLRTWGSVVEAVSTCAVAKREAAAARGPSTAAATRTANDLDAEETRTTLARVLTAVLDRWARHLRSSEPDRALCLGLIRALAIVCSHFDATNASDGEGRADADTDGEAVSPCESAESSAASLPGAAAIPERRLRDLRLLYSAALEVLALLLPSLRARDAQMHEALLADTLLPKLLAQALVVADPAMCERAERLASGVAVAAVEGEGARRATRVLRLLSAVRVAMGRARDERHREAVASVAVRVLRMVAEFTSRARLGEGDADGYNAGGAGSGRGATPAESIFGGGAAQMFDALEGALSGGEEATRFPLTGAAALCMSMLAERLVEADRAEVPTLPPARSLCPLPAERVARARAHVRPGSEAPGMGATHPLPVALGAGAEEGAAPVAGMDAAGWVSVLRAAWVVHAHPVEACALGAARLAGRIPDACLPAAEAGTERAADTRPVPQPTLSLALGCRRAHGSLAPLHTALATAARRHAEHRAVAVANNALLAGRMWPPRWRRIASHRPWDSGEWIARLRAAGSAWNVAGAREVAVPTWGGSSGGRASLYSSVRWQCDEEADARMRRLGLRRCLAPLPSSRLQSATEEGQPVGAAGRESRGDVLAAGGEAGEADRVQRMLAEAGALRDVHTAAEPEQGQEEEGSAGEEGEEGEEGPDAAAHGHAALLRNFTIAAEEVNNSDSGSESDEEEEGRGSGKRGGRTGRDEDEDEDEEGSVRLDGSDREGEDGEVEAGAMSHIHVSPSLSERDSSDDGAEAAAAAAFSTDREPRSRTGSEEVTAGVDAGRRRSLSTDSATLGDLHEFAPAGGPDARELAAGRDGAAQRREEEERDAEAWVVQQARACGRLDMPLASTDATEARTDADVAFSPEDAEQTVVHDPVAPASAGVMVEEPCQLVTPLETIPGTVQVGRTYMVFTPRRLDGKVEESADSPRDEGGSAEDGLSESEVQLLQDTRVAVTHAAARRRRRRRIALRSVLGTFLRRFNLRRNALEVFTSAHRSRRGLMFAFDAGRTPRDRVLRAINRSVARNAARQWPGTSPAAAFRNSGLTRLWQERKLSNFDYLMHLNLLGGRTFSDIMQYPVFPWVLQDYASDSIDLDDARTYRDLTKPVGALNPKRLSEFRARCRSLDSDVGGMPPFLYGSHYSTGLGVVLYFLVRMEPFSLLHVKYQDLRFDVADRLFSSVPAVWSMCTTAMSEVKELTPEWYSNPAFLRNNNRYALGTTQRDTGVNDVRLPPWAESPEHFIAVQREALESEHVSAHLHHWIDLIFGYKQRGPAAAQADNLFFHLTYEGGVDLDAITDPATRWATELQIAHFGQCPSQLLRGPHPVRGAPPLRLPRAVHAAAEPLRQWWRAMQQRMRPGVDSPAGPVVPTRADGSARPRSDFVPPSSFSSAAAGHGSSGERWDAVEGAAHAEHVVDVVAAAAASQPQAWAKKALAPTGRGRQGVREGGAGEEPGWGWASRFASVEAASPPGRSGGGEKDEGEDGGVSRAGMAHALAAEVLLVNARKLGPEGRAPEGEGAEAEDGGGDGDVAARLPPREVDPLWRRDTKAWCGDEGDPGSIVHVTIDAGKCVACTCARIGLPPSPRRGGARIVVLQVPADEGLVLRACGERPRVASVLVTADGTLELESRPRERRRATERGVTPASEPAAAAGEEGDAVLEDDAIAWRALAQDIAWQDVAVARLPAEEGPHLVEGFAAISRRWRFVLLDAHEEGRGSAEEDVWRPAWGGGVRCATLDLWALSLAPQQPSTAHGAQSWTSGAEEAVGISSLRVLGDRVLAVTDQGVVEVFAWLMRCRQPRAVGGNVHGGPLPVETYVRRFDGPFLRVPAVPEPVRAHTVGGEADGGDDEGGTEPTAPQPSGGQGAWEAAWPDVRPLTCVPCNGGGAQGESSRAPHVPCAYSAQGQVLATGGGATGTVHLAVLDLVADVGAELRTAVSSGQPRDEPPPLEVSIMAEAAEAAEEAGEAEADAERARARGGTETAGDGSAAGAPLHRRGITDGGGHLRSGSGSDDVDVDVAGDGGGAGASLHRAVSAPSGAGRGGDVSPVHSSTRARAKAFAASQKARRSSVARGVTQEWAQAEAARARDRERRQEKQARSRSQSSNAPDDPALADAAPRTERAASAQGMAAEEPARTGGDSSGGSGIMSQLRRRAKGSGSSAAGAGPGDAGEGSGSGRPSSVESSEAPSRARARTSLDALPSHGPGQGGEGDGHGRGAEVEVVYGEMDLLTHRAAVTCLSFSGASLAVGSADGTASVWRLHSLDSALASPAAVRTPVAVTEAHPGPLLAVALDDASDTLVTACAAMVQVHSLYRRAGDRRRVLACPHGASRLLLAPSSMTLLALCRFGGGGGTERPAGAVLSWSTCAFPRGARAAFDEAAVPDAWSLTPCEQAVAVARRDWTVEVLATEGLHVLLRFDAGRVNPPPLPQEVVNAIAFGPGGDAVALGTSRGRLIVVPMRAADSTQVSVMDAVTAYLARSARRAGTIAEDVRGYASVAGTIASEAVSGASTAIKSFFSWRRK